MGQEAKNLVINNGLDANKIIEMLNNAYASELIAWFQYIAPIDVAFGQQRVNIIDEFKKHADEELEHAKLLSQRIVQLGGIPVMTLDWNNISSCKFTQPTNFNVLSLLQDNLNSERCAVKLYKGIMDATQDGDKITFKIARNILMDELEHEQDLEDFIKDIGE